MFSENDTGYDACIVEYTDAKTEKTYSYTYRAPGKTGNKIYKENSEVNSYADAESLAKAKLRELNKKETAVSIELPGNVLLLSANPIIITNLGAFNGKYFIDKCRHSIGSGYRTSLSYIKFWRYIDECI